MGSGNVDHRLRQSDFSLDDKAHGGFWLGMPVTYMSRLNRMLVVGSNLRKDHPLMAHRIRQSVRWYGQLNLINAHEDEFLGKVHAKRIVAPSQLATALAGVCRALAELKNLPVPDTLSTAWLTTSHARWPRALRAAAKVLRWRSARRFARQHGAASPQLFADSCAGAGSGAALRREFRRAGRGGQQRRRGGCRCDSGAWRPGPACGEGPECAADAGAAAAAPMCCWGWRPNWIPMIR